MIKKKLSEKKRTTVKKTSRKNIITNKKKGVKKKLMTGTVHKKKSLKKAFKKKELEAIRKKLIAEKERIIQDVLALKGDNINKSFKDLSGDLSGYSFHMADMATDLYDREFSLGLAEGERERLYELDEAVKRIDQGNYGICETCGEKIPSGRLKVMPHAKYCLKHQEEMEKEASR